MLVYSPVVTAKPPPLATFQPEPGWNPSRKDSYPVQFSRKNLPPALSLQWCKVRYAKCKGLHLFHLFDARRTFDIQW